MGSHDWYRNTTWDAGIASTFDARIARSQQPWSKWQQFHIQAHMLAQRGFLDEAIALHRRAIAEVKNVEPTWRRASLAAIAVVLRDQGKREEAMTACREAIAACSLADSTMRGDDEEPEQVLDELRQEQSS